MKRYLIWGIILGALGVIAFCLSIASLSEGNYAYSAGELMIALCDGFMSWDALSNYNKTKQI